MIDCTQGGRSDAQTHRLTERVRQQGYLLHIGHEAALGFDVRMRTVISAHDALLGECTTFGHGQSFIKQVSSVSTIYLF